MQKCNFASIRPSYTKLLQPLFSHQVSLKGNGPLVMLSKHASGVYAGMVEMLRSSHDL